MNFELMKSIIKEHPFALMAYSAGWFIVGAMFGAAVL